MGRLTLELGKTFVPYAKASLSEMGSSGHSPFSVKYIIRFSRPESGTFSRAACSAV